MLLYVIEIVAPTLKRVMSTPILIILVRPVKYFLKIKYQGPVKYTELDSRLL
jgi:hypothetical protein